MSDSIKTQAVLPPYFNVVGPGVGHEPLVAEIPVIDRTVVSTDHEEIAKVAKESGLDTPFYRPDSLSGDRISDLEVLSHALIEIERLDQVNYDIVIMLQPRLTATHNSRLRECA